MTTADVCNRKHGGSDTSVAAFNSLGEYRHLLRDQVLGVIANAGENGATCEDVCEALGKAKFAVSGRISELRIKLGLIYATGELRKTASNRGQKVYRIASDRQPEAPSLSVETIQAIYVANGSTSSIAAKHNVPTTLAAEIRSGGRFRDVTRHLTRGQVPKRRIGPMASDAEAAQRIERAKAGLLF